MLYWLCPQKGIEPEFKDDIISLLTPSEFDWYITSGRRELSEQSNLYAKYLKGGPKAAPPGKSAHNYGLAIDLVPDGNFTKPGLQMMWEISKHVIGVENKAAPWLWLADAIYRHPRLHSGRGFGDWPHVEKVKWQEYKNWDRQ